MIALRCLRFAILFAAVFLALIATPACAADQSSSSPGVPGLPPEPADLVAAFEQRHGEIIAQVQQGILPVDVSAKADNLLIRLRTYLTKTDARMEILQLDALNGAPDERKTALEKIVALAGERERIKMACLQRLQALKTGKATGEGSVSPVTPTSEETTASSDESKANDGKAVDETADTNWQVKDLDVEIEIAPEDIAEGERP